MPELPEVETIRLALEKDIIGKVIEDVKVIVKKQFDGDPEKIIGKKVIAVNRLGKVLSIKLKGGPYISIHLKLTGQLLFAHDREDAQFSYVIPYANSRTMPGKTTHVILYFRGGSALFFNDLRKFGWMRLRDKPDETTSVDVLSKDFILDYFKKSITASNKPIKNLLLEQDKFAGIGNIYANDALWRARIHPLKKGKTLNDVEVGELFAAVKETIAEGLKYDGTSDNFYILPDAHKGNYQDHMKVYHREKLPCLRCGTPIVRIKHSGRSSFYCPKCQQLKM